jgi:hypothetical protein
LAARGFDWWLTQEKHIPKLILALTASLVLSAWIGIPRSQTVANSLIFSTGILSLTIIFFSLSAIMNVKKLLIAIGFVILVTCELFYFFLKFNPFVPAGLLYPEAPVMTWLQQHAGINRFWGYGTAAVEANFSTYYGLYSPDGYDPLYPKRYGEFLGATKDGHIHTTFTDASRSDARVVSGYGENDYPTNPYRAKILSLLGVKYILDRTENGSTAKTFPPEIFSDVYHEDGWIIYENKLAQARYFLATEYRIAETNELFEKIFFDPDFDPGKTVILNSNPGLTLPGGPPGVAKLLSYTPSTVTFKTETHSPQLLFLSDTYDPDWKADIDAIPTPVYRADYAFRAVLVPSGTHIVSFSYRPSTFAIGLKTSMIGLGLLMGMMLYSWRNHEKL